MAMDKPEAEQTNNKVLMVASFGALCLALVAIASAPLLIRVSEQEISPWATAFNRFWLTMVVLGLWCGLKSMVSPHTDSLSALRVQSGDIWLYLLGLGAFFALDLALWAWSLTQTSVANANLFANLTPLFSTVFAWLLWKKKFDWRFMLGMGIALAGVMAIMAGDLGSADGKLGGDVAALMAAIFFCIYLLFLEKLQVHLPITTILFWGAGIAALVSLPLVMLHPQSLLPVSWSGWAAVIALAVVCQIIGHGLLTQSLKYLSSAFVALFFLLDPVLAAIGADIWLQEHLTVGNWFELGIVLGGIAISLSSQSIKQEETLVPTSGLFDKLQT